MASKTVQGGYASVAGPVSASNEKALFKLCIQHPKYTKSLHFTASPTKDQAPSELVEEIQKQKRDLMKAYLRVWCALTKYIKSQCDKGRCLDFPLVGRFLRRITPGGKGDTGNQYVFIPHLDFVESGRYSFPENDFNISPFSKTLPVLFIS